MTARFQDLGTFRGLLRRLLIYTLLMMGAIMFTAPFLWMLSTSFKAPELVFTQPPQFFPNPFQPQNYAEGWQRLPFTPLFIEYDPHHGTQRGDGHLSFGVGGVQLCPPAGTGQRLSFCFGSGHHDGAV